MMHTQQLTGVPLLSCTTIALYHLAEPSQPVIATHRHAVAELHHLAHGEALGGLGARDLGHHLVPPLTCSSKLQTSTHQQGECGAGHVPPDAAVLCRKPHLQHPANALQQYTMSIHHVRQP